jgi:hypothetical protein
VGPASFAQSYALLLFSTGYKSVELNRSVWNRFVLIVQPLQFHDSLDHRICTTPVPSGSLHASFTTRRRITIISKLKTRLLPEKERMNQALIGQLRDLTRKMKVNMTSFEGRQMFYTLVIVYLLASIATQSQWERALAG